MSDDEKSPINGNSWIVDPATAWDGDGEAFMGLCNHAHVLWSPINFGPRWYGPAVRMEKGSALFLSQVWRDEPLEIYFGEQIATIRARAVADIHGAAQAVVDAWRQDKGAQAFAATVDALESALKGKAGS